MRTSITKLFLAVSIVFASVATYSAQTTEFTYQGRLLDGSLPANASYDLEFRLFNSEISGAPIGTVSRPAVMVNTGIFTVKLDFGPVFDGSPRWIEIAVKPAGSAGPFTLLSPRQSISSAPYAVRSLTSSTADTSVSWPMTVPIRPSHPVAVTSRQHEASETLSRRSSRART